MVPRAAELEVPATPLARAPDSSQAEAGPGDGVAAAGMSVGVRIFDSVVFSDSDDVTRMIPIALP